MGKITLNRNHWSICLIYRSDLSIISTTAFGAFQDFLTKPKTWIHVFQLTQITNNHSQLHKYLIYEEARSQKVKKPIQILLDNQFVNYIQWVSKFSVSGQLCITGNGFSEKIDNWIAINISRIVHRRLNQYLAHISILWTILHNKACNLSLTSLCISFYFCGQQSTKFFSEAEASQRNM